ncbi:MAG: ABC transporter ATP-binding protein [Sedimentibacter saalensis]|jgi:putative ABC transport system ATP-binding protein|uniref:Putative ABC transport system ATP-binding protein n=1 Tax=Sedimentibacter saalensis TaxID=130788 RepID=A0A562JBZ3_9FIRM|nr:ABC transporter ATP-binding protein [Sedimentibacter saalensis]MEA5093791.1 ABC transporter ATP-binding protein [Sedimentibacter saalensis]TWH80709.1 putative ABC transport system ATP-binding protein [Sedimentibacter saalensis]
MIDLIDIYKIYQVGDTEIRALDGISLHIGEKEFVAIVGQSGSGKSTCMNMVGCLDIPTSGKYILNGRDVSKLNEDELSEIRNLTLGFIFQQYNLISKLNVFENVELPLIYRGIEKHDRQRMVEESLSRVGLLNRIYNMPSQLSGGQQQRVSIARALSGNPPVILADEPTGALDSKTGQEVLELLKQINEEGSTIVLITHDNSIAHQAKRIIRLHDGSITEDTVLEVVKNEL